MSRADKPFEVTGGMVPGSIASVRGRAWMVASLWWLIAAAVYWTFALSRPGPRPDCEGDGCWNEQGALLLLGIFLGLPVMLIGMAACAVVIGVRARRWRSGMLLGTCVAWAGIRVVVLLVAARRRLLTAMRSRSTPIARPLTQTSRSGFPRRDGAAG
jgi:hypothetical protein